MTELNRDKNKLLHLERRLRRYTFDELHSYLASNSFKIIEDNLNPSTYSRGTVFPWISKSLTLMKIYLGDPSANYSPLTKREFLNFANDLLEFESFSEEINIIDMVPKILVNQHTYQNSLLVSFYRSSFVFNYKNENLNMDDEFNSLIGRPSEEVMYLFYFLYILASKEENINRFYTKLIRFNEVQNFSKIFSSYAIHSDELYETLHKNYNRIDQLILSNIHLDSYCFLVKNDKHYVTYPHNLLSAYYPGTYHRLLNNKPELRQNLGKYLWEEYLYKLVSESNQFSIVEQEQVYKKGKNNINTPDVLALLGDDVFLFEMKSTMPTLLNRSNDNYQGIDDTTVREAKKIKQIYDRITDYKNDLFKVKNESGEGNVYGIIVNLESSYIYPENIFIYFFETYFPNISSEKRKMIEKSIRIIYLSNLEHILLFNNKLSFKQIVFDSSHTDFTFNTGNRSTKDGIVQYQNFVNKITTETSEMIISTLNADS